MATSRTKVIKSNMDFFPSSLICKKHRKKEKPSVIGARAERFNVQKENLVTFVVTSPVSVLQF